VEGDHAPQRLGDLLRQTRESRGWTIAQVETATRISGRQLEALESANLSALPAPVFTRGLVRSYAKHLGLSQVEAEELLLKEEARQETVGVMPPVTARPTFGGEPSSLLRLALIVLLLGVVGGVAYSVLPRYRTLMAASGDLVGVASAASPSPAPAVAPPTAVLATPTTLPTATARPTVPATATVPPSPTLAPPAAATATAAAGIRGVTVEARATGRVWAQAEADGQVVFSGILQTSEKKTWKADRRIVLHVGNAGLVDVTYNGQVLGHLGPEGEVVRQEWTSSR
jgi:cytoskeleton protein RodZ